MRDDHEDLKSRYEYTTGKGVVEVKDLKYDKGKINAALPYEYFPNAIKAIAEVATYGAVKYERGSWQNVKDKEIRYSDAMHRHLLDYNIDTIDGTNSIDPESKLHHLAHFAWNALSILEMHIRNEKAKANG